MLAVTLSACSKEAGNDASYVKGAWLLETSDGQPVADIAESYIWEFDGVNTCEIYLGNTLMRSGTYKVAGPSMTISLKADRENGRPAATLYGKVSIGGLNHETMTYTFSNLEGDDKTMRILGFSLF